MTEAAAQAWPNEAVVAFINAQLNFFDSPTPTPNERSYETTRWKIWLWLEQNGFDFASVSLRAELGRQFGNEARGIDYERERRLLFQIRKAMRSLLELSPLPAETLDDLVRDKPIDFTKHWTAAGPKKGSTSSACSFDEFGKKFVDDLSVQRPGYIKIIKNAVHQLGVPRSFSDNLTGNGNYTLVINDGFVEQVALTLIQSDFAQFYDSIVGDQDYYQFFKFLRQSSTIVSSLL